MAASTYFHDEGESSSPATRSSSDGNDIRWFFSKHPLPENALAASIPKNAIVGRGEFLRFSARDSLALEAAYKKGEEYYDRTWWREFAECSSGPEGIPSSSPPVTTGEDDASTIEEEDTMGVPVKGGLYEVELETRRSFPVYWKGEDRRVLRGQWFARAHSTHWLPLREDVADQLETAYQRRVWRRRSYEPSGLYAARVALAGAQQGQYVLFTGDDSSWEAWLGNEAAWWPQLEPGIPLRRGFVSSSDSGAFTQEDVQQLQEEDRDDYCSQVPVAHVVLMVHGIGQRMDSAHFVEDVTIFRRHTAALAEHHLTKEQRQRQRCLFIPCQWRRELRLAGEAAVEDITPEGVPALRKNVSATVHDVLFYMSPAYCQDIIDSVSSQLNFQYRKFKRRNPRFEGKVSILGHSLGSVLAFDILCHQDPPPDLQNKGVHPPVDPTLAAAIVEGRGGEQKGTLEAAVEASRAGRDRGQPSLPLPPTPSAAGHEGGWHSRDLPLRPDPQCSQPYKDKSRDKDKDIEVDVDVDLCSSYGSATVGFHPASGTSGGTSEEEGRETQYIAPPSPTSLPTSLELARRRRPPRQHMPDIDYARLDFQVDTLYAVGSPLALFLALRNIRIGTGDGPEQLEGIAEEVPACRRLLNIFHPYDPVAYRIEPLISREYVKIPPAYLAHFKGGRRLHIALQEMSDKLGGRVRRVAKGWLRCFQEVQACWEGVFSAHSRKTHEEKEDQLGLEIDDYARHMMTRLTGRAGGRIDYVLQEATFDYQYIVAFKCHLTYWSDWDTALCVIRHLYDDTHIESEAAGSVDAIGANPSESDRDKGREALDYEPQIALTFQSGGRGPVGLLRALQVARSSSHKPPH